MIWKPLESTADLDSLLANSYQSPQVIFKHSTRCATSGLAKNRLQNNPELSIYLLDVIGNRALSNKVADDFNVWHESPQVLIISKGECTYDESHMAIRADEILDYLAA